jgi:hypothetical protein
MSLPSHGWMPEVDDDTRSHYVPEGFQVAPSVDGITYLALCGAYCRQADDVTHAKMALHPRCATCERTAG